MQEDDIADLNELASMMHKFVSDILEKSPLYLLRFLKEAFLYFFHFHVSYSILLCLPPFRFHCVGGCWGRTQNCCDFSVDSRTL
jgi:hypothetical protein